MKKTEIKKESSPTFDKEKLISFPMRRIKYQSNAIILFLYAIQNCCKFKNKWEKISDNEKIILNVFFNDIFRYG